MGDGKKFLEKYQKETFAVLDHGFIQLIDCLGDDAAIVQAARVSYGKGTKSARSDRGLIRYLMKHEHLSPFEMVMVKFHIKMPIFVARQWVRHRTAKINEYSLRYSEPEEDFYFPEKLRKQDHKNKQGSYGEFLPRDNERLLRIMKTTCEISLANYKLLIEEGVSREIARIILPKNLYTRWYWLIDLRNLLHFIKLRMDDHAQYEIQQYAKVMYDLLKEWVPHTMEAFDEFILKREAR